MRSALIKFVVPNLEALGFVGIFPNYQRRRDKTLDILNFQLDKFGGGFVINAGQAPADGLLLPSGMVEAIDLTCGHPLPRRARFQPGRTGNLLDWFRFDNANDENAFEKAAKSVLPFLEGITTWLEKGPKGVRLLPLQVRPVGANDMPIRHEFSLINSLKYLFRYGIWKKCFRAIKEE